MRTTCEGQYVTPSGQNITIGESAIPPNGTHKSVDSCSSHSALNPLGLIEILFEIGIFFTGLSLLVAIWTAIHYTRKKALLNTIISLAALAFLGLGTILTHGVAVAISKLLNLLGSEIGLRTQYGGKFLALAWATVILIIVDIGLWVLIGLFGDNVPGPARQRKVAERRQYDEKKAYEMTPRSSGRDGHSSEGRV